VTNAKHSGRTVWQAQDVLWWSRERVVELGEEFGAAGPAVANWLECQAKAQNNDGLVKSGFRAIARGAFIEGGHDRVREIVEYAVEIGFLKEYEAATRTFVARVSAFQVDQPKGAAALNKAAQRADTPATGADAAGSSGSAVGAGSGRACPSGEDKSGSVRSCPPREEKRTEEASLREATRAAAPAARPAPPADQLPDDFPDELKPTLREVLPVLRRIAAGKGANEVTVRAAARAVAQFPRRPHVDAALDLEHWLLEGTGQRNKVKDVVGYYRNQLRDRWQDKQTSTPGGPPPRARTGKPTGDPGYDQTRHRRALALRASQGDEEAQREYDELLAVNGRPATAGAV
jgi:hypothetical protein